MHVVVRWLINALALLAAAFVVPGIHLSASGRPGLNEWVTLAIVAAIFGVINTIIRPVVLLLTLPLTIITLGLFVFVINALMLILTGWLSESWNLGFSVAGFWPAFWGGLVVGLVSLALSLIFPARREE